MFGASTCEVGVVYVGITVELPYNYVTLTNRIVSCISVATGQVWIGTRTQQNIFFDRKNMNNPGVRMATRHIFQWTNSQLIRYSWRTWFSGGKDISAFYHRVKSSATRLLANSVDAKFSRRSLLTVWFIRRECVHLWMRQLCSDSRSRGYHAANPQTHHRFRSGFYRNLRTADTSRHHSTERSQDTIFALSSGQGKCGVAVIRVSGPKTSGALLQITRTSRLPKAKVVSLTKLFNTVDGEAVDKGLVVWFPGPQSFTGEDVCEFHVHGGPAVVTAMHSVLDTIEGLRHAEPGEFTKRAFLNGKLDMTEVEGLGDLIHAETEAQRRQALRQMDGDLSKMYRTWTTQLLKCVAHVEAFIDFSEDENIEEGVLDQAQAGVSRLLRDIRAHLDDNRCGERLRSGVQVAIIGRPNVGKSSLLNLLCQRPAAIVTPIAGTTRDVIESGVNIGGYPVLLLDTAGLRETQDVVEQEGVRRAKQRAEDADITVVMVEATDILSGLIPRTSSMGGRHGNNLEAILDKYLQDTTLMSFGVTERSCEDTETGFEKDTLVVLNKSDLLDDAEEHERLESFVRTHNKERTKEQMSVCVLSCETNHGVDNFLEVLRGKVETLCGNPLVGNPSLTQSRHRSNLKECVAALEAFSHQQDLVMAAEQLRIALGHLGKITGSVGVEDILNVVFQDFCIGK